MDQQTAYQQSIAPQDKVAATATLYDAGYGEIFLKNFTAGASRALGGIVLYVIFLVVAANVFLRFAWPHIEPFVQEYRQAMDSINKLNTTALPASGPDAQQFLRDLQESLPR